MTPTLPSRPEPPLGVLPPDGITPSVPVRPTPPIAVLPPEGLQPERPPAQRPDQGMPLVMTLPCHGQASAQIDASAQRLDPCSAPEQQTNTQVPLTPGRDLLEDSLWNSWADARALRTKDQRSGFESSSRSGTLTFGVDRQVHSGLAIGIMASALDAESRRYSGSVTQESSGFSVGPYLSQRISEHWSLFGSMGLGYQRDDHQVVSLSGEANVRLFSASLNAQGQHALSEESFLRPRIGLSYQHTKTDSFMLAGQILGQSVSVGLDAQQSESWSAESSFEINREIRRGKDQLYVPFAEFGARYTKQWPNSASSNVLQSDYAEWLGFVRLGGRVSLGARTQIELNASYQSIGVSKLDSWEAGLFLSHAF
ncbi:autotransporter outer membrane beta-barrel domain-containing protein [Uliginosibacterium sp. 31-12]|uniref:autotransporter outer membrane beta-barrel domain-containing protein n=1 Tax=Uliginosibacterium sp. 31-12 TaxID=3062781 RepID=UPI0026E40238|nr:autotransporter domain-containing protein [Uliginosibacterium sp. 31-12]